jgi:hypothetical protein
MSLNPPRVGEILAGVFGALLVLSLFLPWYRTAEPATVGCDPERASCPQETLTGFEALAAVDVVLLVVGLGGVALLLLEMTQRTTAVPVAWSALLAPLAVVGFVLVLWRVISPPGEAEEPLFAFLGLVASGGITAATLLSMRNESHGWRSRGPVGPVPAGGSPEPLSVPRIPGEVSRESPR